MQWLRLLVALALLGCTHAQAVVAPPPSSYTSSTGKLSVSGGHGLSLPPWFFPAPGQASGEAAPGGVAVAQVCYTPARALPQACF